MHEHNKDNSCRKSFDLSNDLFSEHISVIVTIAQKVKFSIKDFFSKCDQIRRKLKVYIEISQPTAKLLNFLLF